MSEYLPISWPSKCLVYEGVDVDSITVRAYQGRDEVYLSQINSTNLERNYFELLKDLIRGLDPKNLTLGDRLYLIVWECINSYTNIIQVRSICSECIEEIDVAVDLKKLDVTHLPDDFKQPYEITLPVSNKKISLRLFTVTDEIAVEKYNQKHKDGLLYRYARSVVTEDDLLAVLAQFNEMHAKDFTAIRAWHEKFYHGPNMEAVVSCPKCDEEVTVDVPFRLDFFFPDGDALRSTFGKGV